MEKIIFEPIGVIHSPFKDVKGVPIQPPAAKGIKGEVEIFNDYVEGLKDLNGFSHIYLLFYFHKSTKYTLTVVPYMDKEPRGVFATRAPRRPNKIGISVVRLKTIIDNIILIEDVDIVDGTPLLDIKPYVPMFDQREEVTTGWLGDDKIKLAKTKDDGRFSI